MEDNLFADKKIRTNCQSCGKRVVLGILCLNIALLLIKGFLAYLSSSRALWVDTAISLANIIITLIIYVSLKIALQPGDEKHHYGYGKLEFVIAAIINILLLIGSLVYIILSIRELIITGPENPPGMIACGAALVSILLNEPAFRWGKCVGEKLNSNAIIANAWNSRADEATSLIVLIAVIFANLGFYSIDHIAAIIMAFYVIKVMSDGLAESYNGLMDTRHNIGNLDKVKAKICSISGIQDINCFNARKIGRRLHLYVEIVSDKKTTVGMTGMISKTVKDIIKNEIAEADIIDIRFIPESI